MSRHLPGPALAMLDLEDVPHGLLAVDGLTKEAEVTLVRAGTIQSGRYLVLFGGDVESVQRAHARALELTHHALVDEVLLPYAEERILPALDAGEVRWPARPDPYEEPSGDTAGILQASSCPTLLRALDAALKGALVDLVSLRAGDGLSGQAVGTLWGETHDVDAALELAQGAAQAGRAARVRHVALRNASPEVVAAMQPNSRFFSDFRG